MHSVNRLWQTAVLAVGLLLIDVPDANAYGRVVRCESHGDNYTRCRVLIRSRVQLYRQLSHASCRFNETWGYDADGIWVMGGCRGDFVVDGSSRDDEHRDQRGWEDERGRGGSQNYDRDWDDRNYNQGYGKYGNVIRCESSDDQYRYCPANTRGGVLLRRQLSRSDCEQGRTWGYDRGGVWVDRGCRAEFAIQSRKK